jgi:hypothetical protein
VLPQSKVSKFTKKIFFVIIIEILHYTNEVLSNSYWRDGGCGWAVGGVVVGVICLAAQLQLR